MTKLNDKSYKEFNNISKKEGIECSSDLEMRQSADNLVELVNLLIEMESEERTRKKRLEDVPKGYSMDGNGRNCSLCGQMIYGTNGWYDKWGFKCMNCQNAVNKKIIPGSMCGDYKHEKCIVDTSLAWKSKLHVQTIRKLIRSGKIKARQIPNGPYVILRKDNPNLASVVNKEINKKK